MASSRPVTERQGDRAGASGRRSSWVSSEGGTGVDQLLEQGCASERGEERALVQEHVGGGVCGGQAGPRSTPEPVTKSLCTGKGPYSCGYVKDSDTGCYPGSPGGPMKQRMLMRRRGQRPESQR